MNRRQLALCILCGASLLAALPGCVSGDALLPDRVGLGTSFDAETGRADKATISFFWSLRASR